MKIHHLNNSRSQRVLWLLEELGLEYEIVRYERDAKTMLAPAALRKIHPLGKSPVLEDGVVRLAESGAIIEYLVSTYGQGRLVPPAGTPERIRYLYWMHYAEGSAMPPLLMKLVFDRMPQGPVPTLLRPLVRMISRRALTTLVNPQLALHMDYWESELGKANWFAGEFSAADIQMSFPLEAAAARAGLAKGRPKAMAFLERIHARPAFQKALKRGGPYELLR